MAEPINGPSAPGDGPGRHERDRRLITRRRLIGSAGAVVAATVVGGAAFEAGRDRDVATGDQRDTDRTSSPEGIVPFHGAHQAGVVTPAQDRLHAVAFDVTTDRRDDLVGLLRAWTGAASSLSIGRRLGGSHAADGTAPVDTGEAAGLPAARLTVTIGFGPALFERAGDPFGLRDLKPDALTELPRFPTDRLDPARSGGDILVQACADDPLIAFHAIHNLARIGRGVVVPRWSQVGFGPTSGTSRGRGTPRNLMGFKDGTNNLTDGDPVLLRDFVWVGSSDGPAWMAGGTYAVTRRIRMLLERWDASAVAEQERAIGRAKLSGAPLGRSAEFDTVPLTARGPDGHLVIPADAHIRVAAPTTNAGVRLLRRGYSFADGVDPETGRLDAGLFFVCFQRDPRTQFVAVQRRLSASDALNGFIVHVSSGIFAIPPGIAPGGYVGETLFGA
jgi:deferrochelatase/peroxidase EfeB